MADLVDVMIEESRWQAADLAGLSERAAQATLAHLQMDAAGYEISLMGCDDVRITALNGDFREKPRATNVLSWPSQERAAQTPGLRPELPDPGGDGWAKELGDIAISYDTCVREAKASGREMSDHVTHLIVHGVLHLLGFDHINDEDAALMQKLEVQILGKLGLLDPYRE